ncbi:hypothetical protein C8Q76DRAFT_611286, partial [Earliella scabrosa]
ELDHFTNPTTTSHTAPQRVHAQGLIQGHLHVTIGRPESLDQTQLLDSKEFVSSKGLNDETNDGTLSAEDPGGLPAAPAQVRSRMGRQQVRAWTGPPFASVPDSRFYPILLPRSFMLTEIGAGHEHVGARGVRSPRRGAVRLHNVRRAGSRSRLCSMRSSAPWPSLHCT